VAGDDAGVDVVAPAGDVPTGCAQAAPVMKKNNTTDRYRHIRAFRNDFRIIICRPSSIISLAVITLPAVMILHAVATSHPAGRGEIFSFSF